ncbi:MAG: lactate utilization protein [Ruminococcus sp.]|nr:lactate utilization protein [Ruminococcus sp.]
MDNNMKSVIIKRINKTGESLKKNNMEFYFAETKNDVAGIVESLIKESDVITNGGTMTMAECELPELLSSPKYKYLDRTCMTPDEIQKLYIDSFSADVYITSSNAITEDGLLYNVDGNSNRVAAIAYGPKSVIVIAGYNKIVKNLAEAELRVKSIAAPANCERLSCETYCRETGECMSLAKPEREMCDGCASPARICCNYLISAYQRHKGRIKVILVGEELGY